MREEGEMKNVNPNEDSEEVIDVNDTVAAEDGTDGEGSFPTRKEAEDDRKKRGMIALVMAGLAVGVWLLTGQPPKK